MQAGIIFLSPGTPGLRSPPAWIIDPACEYPFTANNRAELLLKSVEDIAGSDFADALSGASLTVLAGCAPCQPFSTYSRGVTAQWQGVRTIQTATPQPDDNDVL